MSQHKPDIRKANICPPCPATATVWQQLIYWLGIGLGSGLPKRAAGTWGTVGGLLIAMPMVLVGFWGFVALTLLAGLVGAYVCGKTSELMGVHDDPHIVFDEWVGMWITLLPIVYGWHSSANANFGWLNWVAVVLAFILFRFFDIIKPFPIKWVDKNVSGGFGILIDDVIAGVMAGLVLLMGLLLVG